MLDWSDVVPKKKPTKRQKALYHRWVAYLRDSRLTESDIQSRAKLYAERLEAPPAPPVINKAPKSKRTSFYD